LRRGTDLRGAPISLRRDANPFSRENISTFFSNFRKKNARFRFFRRRRRIKSTKDAVASRSKRVRSFRRRPKKSFRPLARLGSVRGFFSRFRNVDKKRRAARIDRDSQNNAQGKAA